ncbi:tetratricopeptide repeat protein, partial [Candidatus Kapabacteria bacterium]|nr:tetratricopeptide repeat protein [Candidatus Kapabacteria bacterium]
MEILGVVHERQSNYPKALEYSEKSLKLYEELGNKTGMARNLGNIGIIYMRQFDYPKALEYYPKALEINEELGNKLGVAINLENIAALYLNLSQDSVNINPSELNEFVSINKDINLDNGIQYTKESISIFEEIGELNKRSNALKNLAKAYKQKGEFEKALDAHEEYVILKDSVFNQENTSKINALTTERDRIEAERAEEKAAIAKEEADSRRNRLQYLAIGAVVVFLGVILLLSGCMNMKEWMARALVFLSFIFLFEFILVIIDPWTDEYSEGIPLIKFGINMALALVIFPMHQYFEKRVSLKVV